MFQQWIILVVMAGICLLILQGFAGAAEPVNIGSRLELFVDDFLIDKMQGIELMLHHPVPREKVFTFDAPWEGDTSAYVTVFKDGGKYLMFYRGSRSATPNDEYICMAESTDGIKWVRPGIGLFPVPNAPGNNIVWIGDGSHSLTPFKDTNPGVTPDAVYKAVGPISGPDKKSVLQAFASLDGLHWRMYPVESVITRGAFDSQNVAFWDSERKEYVCYYRDYKKVRDIKRATSKDFIHWSEGEWLSYTGAPAEHLYTNAIIPYFRAPHIYLGFPKRFMPDRKLIDSHPVIGVSDGVFMSSRDGLHFHRWAEGFMRPGPDPNNWTDRSVMAAWGIFELTPGEISIYYSQHYRHATNHLIRATLRTDGFVSLHAGGDSGEVITKPLIFQGKEMVLNLATSAAGGIRVELQDEFGAPIPGYRLDDCPLIYGDEIERVVRWKNGADVSSLAGKPVRIRFEIKDGDVYSMKFRP